ncbi:hypothetical protein Tco_0622838 [Tanacetum coccineum]
MSEDKRWGVCAGVVWGLGVGRGWSGSWVRVCECEGWLGVRSWGRSGVRWWCGSGFGGEGGGLGQGVCWVGVGRLGDVVWWGCVGKGCWVCGGRVGGWFGLGAEWNDFGWLGLVTGVVVKMWVGGVCRWDGRGLWGWRCGWCGEWKGVVVKGGVWVCREGKGGSVVSVCVALVNGVELGKCRSDQCTRSDTSVRGTVTGVIGHPGLEAQSWGLGGGWCTLGNRVGAVTAAMGVGGWRSYSQVRRAGVRSVTRGSGELGVRGGFFECRWEMGVKLD